MTARPIRPKSALEAMSAFLEAWSRVGVDASEGDWRGCWAPPSLKFARRALSRDHDEQGVKEKRSHGVERVWFAAEASCSLQNTSGSRRRARIEVISTQQILGRGGGEEQRLRGR